MQLGDCYDYISSFIRKYKNNIEYTIDEIIPGINSNFGKYYGKVTLENGRIVFIEMLDGGSREVTEEKFITNVSKSERSKFISSIKINEPIENTFQSTVDNPEERDNEKKYTSIQEYLEQKGMKAIRAFSKTIKGIEIVTIVTEKGEVIKFQQENDNFILIQDNVSEIQVDGNDEPR